MGWTFRKSYFSSFIRSTGYYVHIVHLLKKLCKLGVSDRLSNNNNSIRRERVNCSEWVPDVYLNFKFVHLNVVSQIKLVCIALQPIQYICQSFSRNIEEYINT